MAGVGLTIWNQPSTSISSGAPDMVEIMRMELEVRVEPIDRPAIGALRHVSVRQADQPFDGLRVSGFCIALVNSAGSVTICSVSLSRSATVIRPGVRRPGASPRSAGHE